MSEVRGGDKRSYPLSEVRGSSWEELPHAPKPEAWGGGREELPHAPTPEAKGGSEEALYLVQGKEQRLRFAGEAVKRYPTPKVRETQVRG